jgi:hypothetical protein
MVLTFTYVHAIVKIQSGEGQAMEHLEFNYKDETVEFVNTYSMLRWIQAFHGAAVNCGAYDLLDTETKQQLTILAKVAEHHVVYAE